MPSIQLPLPSSPPQCDAADEQAQVNYARNMAALRAVQPGIGQDLRGASAALAWIFGRDGSLTGIDVDERWWGDCSLPLRAAKFMLKTLEIRGVVACFLVPGHAAQLRVALDMLEPEQAVVAIVPSVETLWVILHCGDFSSEIAAHRLCFAAGESWPAELVRLFVENPGLPTPAQFIRPILADTEPADRLIAPAQKVFAEETARRAAALESVISRRNLARAPLNRLAVIAPSRFRLWQDAPAVLADQLTITQSELKGIGLDRIDTDDPASASPLAVGQRIANCDAVITANLTRGDAPGIAPRDLPWITWITVPRIPTAETAGPYDRLLLADESWTALARKAGWAAGHLHLGGWPRPAGPAPLPRPGHLALVADTMPLDAPEQVREYSSHRLLWEVIEHELIDSPFVLGRDFEAYLTARMQRMQVAEGGFNRGLFIERLIVPAYQQGIARLLLAEDLPLSVYGKEWDSIDIFSTVARGPVKSRGQLCDTLARATALVHAWPIGHAHPIEAAGRPVLHTIGRKREAFLAEARQVLQAPLQALPSCEIPSVSAALVRSLLRT